MKNKRKAAPWMVSAAIRIGCLTPGCLLWGGCDHRPADQHYQVVVPEEITADGKQWQKQPWSSKDDQRLEAYFRRYPSLAENPGFYGQRITYTNRLGSQRYYWVNPVDDTCQWILLEFQGARAAEVVEGEGEPFVELVRKD